jgi:hypothetical protein
LDLIKKISDLGFALLTFIFRDIFSITDLLCQILQSKSLNISYCQDRINDAVTRLNSLRNEEIFRTIFNTAKNLTSLSSKRGITSNENEIFTNYKILFYEILDSIKLQLTTRFQDLQKLSFLSLVDSSRFSEYSKEFASSLLKELDNIYPRIFDINRLNNELSVLYRDVQFFNLNIINMLQLIDSEFKDILRKPKSFCHSF